MVVDTAVLQTPSSLGRVLQASALGESRGEEQQKRTALVDTAVLQLPHSRRWVDASPPLLGWYHGHLLWCPRLAAHS